MRIGIFAEPGDLVAQQLGRVAEELGHDARPLSLESVRRGGRAAFDGESWFLDGEQIDSCDGFLLVSFPSPHNPPRGASKDSKLSIDEWWQGSLVQQEISSFAQSCIMAMQAAGKPVINPWLECAAFDHKPLQLAVLERAGVPIPATVVTNTAAAARAFCEAAGEVIIKPTTGGAETRIVDDALLGTFESLHPPPTIFQERVHGTDVRVTLVDGEVISAVEIPTAELDYRADTTYRAGEQTYVPHELSDAARRHCVLAAEACRHILSGIDLKQTDDGTYVVLEANSAPVYLEIETKTGAEISRAVVEALERRVG